MYQRILVAIDDSDLAVDVAAKAVAFAKSLDAHVVFFHARSDFAATSDGAVLHALSPAEFDERAPGHALAVVARAEAEARMAGVSFESLVRTSDRPYEAILDAAQMQACDLIFMASHGRKGLRGLLMGSQTEKVLAHATLPVLVSSVETNATHREMETALDVIRGEHRSIAAVIHGLKQAVVEARGAEFPVEPRFLRGATDYLRRFTATLHHPKEDAHLFARLRARSAEANAVLDVLEGQHAEEAALITALSEAAEAYIAQPDAAHLDALSAAADRYAERQWEHMSLEEKLVLPVCQRHLEQDDWVAIARAFASNEDPRFDADRKQGFDRLFLRLVSFAQ